MTLTEIRSAERVALLETLARVGPEAPTLCADWLARDLAAHLVVSERYLGLPKAVGYPLRRVLPPRTRERAMAGLQAVGARQITALRRRGWDWIVERLERGSPALYRLASIAPIRLIEEWVHHEDIRRANGELVRRNSRQLDDALWAAGQLLAGMPEFAERRRGVEVRLGDGRSRRIGSHTLVRVEGDPGELLLFLSGRASHAQVTVDGEEEAIRELTEGLAV